MRSDRQCRGTPRLLCGVRAGGGQDWGRKTNYVAVGIILGCSDKARVTAAVGSGVKETGERGNN